MKTERISIRITGKKKQKFMKAAQLYGLPLSQLIENIVDEWCADNMPTEWILAHSGMSIEDQNKILRYLKGVENE